MQKMGQHDTILLINFDIHVGVMYCVLSSKIMKHCHLLLQVRGIYIYMCVCVCVCVVAMAT